MRDVGATSLLLSTMLLNVKLEDGRTVLLEKQQICGDGNCLFWTLWSGLLVRLGLGVHYVSFASIVLKQVD